LQIEGSAYIEFNKEKGSLSLTNKLGKVLFSYSAPLALLSDNRTITLPLDWDATTSSLSVTIPDLSFPLVLAFGISGPDAKGGLNFGFPSFQFGAKGEVEEESSESDENEKAKGGFGFGFGGKAPKLKVYIFPTLQLNK
jgi:hypothetical protein